MEASVLLVVSADTESSVRCYGLSCLSGCPVWFVRSSVVSGGPCVAIFRTPVRVSLVGQPLGPSLGGFVLWPCTLCMGAW